MRALGRQARWSMIAVISVACTGLAMSSYVSAVAASSPPIVKATGPAERQFLSSRILPAALANAASSTVASRQPEFSVHRQDGKLVSEGGGLRTSFAIAGPTLSGPNWQLSMHAAQFGRAGDLAPLATAAPVFHGEEVTYKGTPVSAWYRNGAFGLEQGFTIWHRPAGNGPLVLAIRTSGNLAPYLTGADVAFGSRKDPSVLTYGDLNARSRTGRSLPVVARLGGPRTVLLEVDGSGASYPITVDPFVQETNELLPNDPDGFSSFGWSVAMSGDGNTALIGGWEDGGGAGAAWIFTRTTSGWAQDGSKLTPSDESGDGGFGTSVALSENGTTALIGGPSDNGGSGAAWVFDQTSSGWAQDGSKLTPNDESGSGNFGDSVAISEEGSTAVIGGDQDDQQAGAAWIFVLSGSTWVQKGDKLTPSDASSGQEEFGESVAISAAGNEAVIGGPGDADGAGAAWIFAAVPQHTVDAQLHGAFEPVPIATSTVWEQQGGKLTDGAGNFGIAVALSGDGSTAVIGSSGEAWVFVGSGATWGEQAELLSSDGASAFGLAVAISSDGTTAVVGARGDNSGAGSLWVFSRSGTTWGQVGGPITASNESQPSGLGFSVAVSADGTSTVAGNWAKYYPGAWIFSAAAPAVSAVSPATGSTAGGTTVTINGSNFTGATAVDFGTNSATFSVLSDGTISAQSPMGAPGTVDITVTGPSGTSATSSADTFLYSASTTTTAPITTSTAPTTTTTAPKAKTAKRPSWAPRVLFASVTGRTNHRVLEVEVKVQGTTKVALALFTGKNVKNFSGKHALVSWSFSVKSGTYELATALPKGLAPRKDTLRVVFSAPHHKKTETAPVAVPA